MSEKENHVLHPDWLTSAFIEMALKKGLHNESLKVLDYDIEMATSTGDHYASHMFRVNLRIKRGNERSKDDCEKLSVIVKAPAAGVMKEETRVWKAFEKEGAALSRILPLAKKILKTAYPDQSPFGALCYYNDVPPNEVLVLEDLRPSGFVLADRFQGFDMEHTTLVLTSLAKLHAASVIINENNPDLMEPFHNSFWKPENFSNAEKFFKGPLKQYSKAVLNWPEFEKKEQYSEKFKNMENILREKLLPLWKRNDKKVNVLLHGDSWVNNFMFRYDSTGKVAEIRFVDFQLAFFNSLVMDLHYFIFSSTSLDIKFKKLDTFLKIYHEAFVSTLEKLNYKISFTFDQLKSDFEEKYFWGLIVLCTIFPLITQPKEQAPSAEDFYCETKMALYCETIGRSDVRKTFKEGLPFFESKGVF